MKDFRLTLSIKNNLILRRIESLGYSSVKQFCETTGSMNLPQLYDLINLRSSPFNVDARQNGGYGLTWRSSVLRLAKALDCLPEDLFSADLLRERETNKISMEVDAAEVALLSGTVDDVAKQLAESPDLVYTRREMAEKISSALDSRLSPMERLVIRERYGLNESQQEHTLREIGESIGRSCERVRQIESRALQKLRKSGLEVYS